MNVWVENAPGIDTYNLLLNATNLVRGRLPNVYWIMPNADLLLRLATLKGIDANGNPIDTIGSFYLTGNAHVTNITNDEISAVNSAFPSLNLSYDNIVGTYTVTFKNYDDTILNTQTVRSGANATNPITAGLIATPTKPSTVDTVYSFTGWDKDLSNVIGNRVLVAQFASSVRKYTVKFYNGDTLLQTNVVNAYSYANYEGEDLVSSDPDKIWLGFDKSTANVTSDVNAYALFVSPTLPDAFAQNFDYLYSDDQSDNSGYSLQEFYGIIASGRAKDYFALGDKIKIVPGTNVFADSEIIMSIIGFNHFKLENGNNFASVVFHMDGIMNATHRMNATNNNAEDANKVGTGGWGSCEMRDWLNNTIFPELPIHWKSLIKTVQVLSSKGGTSQNIGVSNDKLFLLSYAEMGFSTTEVPYKNEVDANAEQLTFSVFTTNNDRIRKYYNGTGSASFWWLRSPLATGSTNFCNIFTYGSGNTNSASYANGVAFGFCI